MIDIKLLHRMTQLYVYNILEMIQMYTYNIGFWIKYSNFS